MNIKVKVAVIVMNSQGEVLLIKERCEHNSVALWNVIKGTYDGGETIYQAAIRECKEEASVDIELTHSLGVFVSNEHEKIRVQCNFLATTKDIAHISSREDQQQLKESIEEVRWHSKDELSLMKPTEFISHRAYELLQDWMKGNMYPLDALKQVKM